MRVNSWAIQNGNLEVEPQSLNNQKIQKVLDGNIKFYNTVADTF